MGPRRVSRGNSPRIHRDERAARTSMGPRRVSRGNMAERGTAIHSAIELQWGRGVLAAEIPKLKRRLRNRSMPTSMGPRRVSRGNLRLGTPFSSLNGTSMGPRRVSRGNKAGRWVATNPLVTSMGPRRVSRGNLVNAGLLEEDSL